VTPAFLEAEVAALHQAARDGRHDDLGCARQGHDSRGRVDSNASDVIRQHLHLAGMDADPELDAQASYRQHLLTGRVSEPRRGEGRDDVGHEQPSS
jgi:hypothetical protein